MKEADRVLEHMNQNVGPQWGLSDPRSKEHYRRISDLFSSWNREQDAEAILRRLNEATNCFSAADASPLAKFKPQLGSRPTLLRLDELDTEADDIGRQLRRIRRQLADTPSTITPNDMQDAIIKVMSQCQEADPKPYLQLLEAATLLAQVSSIVNTENAQTLQNNAADICLSILNDRKAVTKRILQAAVKVAHQLVDVTKGASSIEITTILERISTKAEALFGFANLNYISILFSIGRMYASNGALKIAKRWIEHAMSAAMSLVGCSNYLIDTLQTLRESGNSEEFERQSVKLNSALEKLQRRGADIWTTDGGGDSCEGNIRLMVLRH